MFRNVGYLCQRHMFVQASYAMHTCTSTGGTIWYKILPKIRILKLYVPSHQELCGVQTKIWELWELRLRWTPPRGTRLVASPRSSWAISRAWIPNILNAPVTTAKYNKTYMSNNQTYISSAMPCFNLWTCEDFLKVPCLHGNMSSVKE